MSEESTTPDLVELVRQAFDAGNRHDVDAVVAFHAPEAVWDLSDQGLGTYEGAAAIRSWVEDWFGTWADLRLDVLDVVDLGHGVAFSRVREGGRLSDGDGHVEQQRGWVILGAQEKIERIEIYLDIDQARAAAQRLAQASADG
jgi:ketosteroid isomerase-like protein